VHDAESPRTRCLHSFLLRYAFNSSERLRKCSLFPFSAIHLTGCEESCCCPPHSLFVSIDTVTSAFPYSISLRAPHPPISPISSSTAPRPPNVTVRCVLASTHGTFDEVLFFLLVAVLPTERRRNLSFVLCSPKQVIPLFIFFTYAYEPTIHFRTDRCITTIFSPCLCFDLTPFIQTRYLDLLPNVGRYYIVKSFISVADRPKLFATHLDVDRCIFFSADC